MTPFISAEYQGTPSSICPQANSMGLSTIFKSVNLLNTPLTECVTASASQARVITSPNLFRNPRGSQLSDHSH